MFAMKDDDGQWWRITTFCKRCGLCCMDREGQKWPRHMNWIDEWGRCKWLKEDASEPGLMMCALLVDRPQSCSGNNPHIKPDYCGVEFEKVTDPSTLL